MFSWWTLLRARQCRIVYTEHATPLPANWSTSSVSQDFLGLPVSVAPGTLAGPHLGLLTCCFPAAVLLSVHQLAQQGGTPAGRSLSSDWSLPCCRTCLASPVGAAQGTRGALAAPAAPCRPPPAGWLARPQGPAPTLTSRERHQVGTCHILTTEASPSVSRTSSDILAHPCGCSSPISLSDVLLQLHKVSTPDVLR